MHGRLKVKTSAEKEAEKRKEREEKRKIYLAGLNLVFTKRKENVCDNESLTTSAKLLFANPDALTLWSVRREVLLAMKKEDDLESWKGLLLEDLRTTEHCLLQNPKSYGAWLHRDWIMRVHPEPPYKDEIELCDKYLQMDERNFHCWDHRRLILSKWNQRTLSEELNFTQELINQNFSNYSAWHYRSKLLPLLYPNENNSPLPLPEDVFIKELKQVVTAVFTDPSDQSPWFFLRWLLRPSSEASRLVEYGLMNSGKEVELILVFQQQTSNPSQDLSVVVGQEENPSILQLQNLTPLMENDKHVWVLPIGSKDAFPLSIRIKYRDTESKVEAKLLSELPVFERCAKKGPKNDHLSPKVKDALQEIVDNCILLDEIDPGNKWVLLTLVNLMWTMDLTEFEGRILSFLTQLRDIDPLRKAYYMDLGSTVKIEAKLMQRWSAGNLPHIVDFSHQQLTRLSHSSRFVSAREVDLSGNSLRSLEPLGHFLSCKLLILDGNPVGRDLTPLAYLKQLRSLSLKACTITTISTLRPLSVLSLSRLLESVNIGDNPVVKDIENGATFDGIENLVPLLKY